MIRSAPELKAAIEQAARDKPGGRHVFEIGEGLGRLDVRNLPITGRVEIVGGSLHSVNIRESGSFTFRGVRFYGQQQLETWGVPLRQIRFSGANANLAFFDCLFEGEGEPWNRSDAILVDYCRRLSVRHCRFRGVYNGVSCAGVGFVECLGNDFRQIINDAMAVRNFSPDIVPRITFTARDNLVMDVPEAKRGHTDAIQITSVVPVDMDVRRNVFWSPGRSMQGVFTQTEVNGVIGGNVMLIRSPNAIYAYRSGSISVVGNAIATELSRDPKRNAARIAAVVPGMSAQRNVTYRLAGPIEDAGGNVAIPRGAYQGRLRGPWRAGEWGDVLASPPPLDAPARAVKAALRRALAPV